MILQRMITEKNTPTTISTKNALVLQKKKPRKTKEKKKQE
jgi:hypothetical protein